MPTPSPFLADIAPAPRLTSVGVERHVLPHGLTLLIERDSSHPLVAFHAVVNAGSATEGPFLGSGISHLVEHMLFKGTSRRGVGDIEKEARSCGGAFQGFTTYDTTSYQLVVNKESFSQAADLFVDTLFFPKMDPEEFTREKEVVLREMKLGKDDPGHRVWELLFGTAYRLHPYRLPIIGEEPIFRRITREDAVAYHRTHYQPQGTVIAVVGDIDPPEVKKRIEELTRGIVPTEVALPVLPQEPKQLSPRRATEQFHVSHAIVALGFQGVALSDPDLYALDLLAWLLSQDRLSRLQVALKETGIVYGIEASNFTPRQRGLFMINMRLEPSKISSALAVLHKELREIAEKPFSQEEVEQAKRAFVRGYLASRQTVAGQAGDLATFETLAGDPSFAVRYVEEVRKITPDDLLRAARVYLRPENATTVTLLPEGQAEVSLPAALEPSASAVNVEKITLKNGMRLLLREDHRIPLVNVYMAFLGGLRYEEPFTNGISLLTSRMLLRGTRRRNAQEIALAVRKLGAEVDSVSGRNSVGLVMEVGSGQLAEGLSLLAELALSPVFPAQEQDKERSVALAQLDAKEEDPFAWGMKRLSAALFTAHPYGMDPAGSREPLSRLRSQDCALYYKRLLDPRKMVVSVVGDFKKEEVAGLLEKSFAGLEVPTHEEPSIPQEPPLTERRERREATPRQEGIVMVAFPGVRVSDARAPVLDLAESVLSGGAGRLFTQVRERKGLAYTVGAFSVHGVDPGLFVLYAVTDPLQQEDVLKTLLEEARFLGMQPVPDQELSNAKQGLLGSRRIHRETLGSIAAQMSLDELYGLGWDFSEKYEARVAAITAQDLQRVAKELIDPDRCVVLVGTPVKEEQSRPQEPLDLEKVPAGAAR